MKTLISSLAGSCSHFSKKKIFFEIRESRSKFDLKSPRAGKFKCYKWKRFLYGITIVTKTIKICKINVEICIKTMNFDFITLFC